MRAGRHLKSEKKDNSKKSEKNRRAQKVGQESSQVGSDGSRPKSVFVMNFPGDVQASQLNELREEITGVIRNAQPGDEALVGELFL